MVRLDARPPECAEEEEAPRMPVRAEPLWRVAHRTGEHSDTRSQRSWTAVDNGANHYASRKASARNSDWTHESLDLLLSLCRSAHSTFVIHTTEIRTGMLPWLLKTLSAAGPTETLAQ